MKIIFVDAENVGFKGLEAIHANILDKVFVFSRVESIQQFSQKKLYLCLSDYPEGANQADFYIVAYLARLLNSTTKAELKAIEFILYSDDINLINAFKFQCDLCGATQNIISFQLKHNAPELSIDDSLKCSQSSKTHKNSKPVKALSNCQVIFNLLNKPTSLFEIEKRLKLSKSNFTKAINELVKDKKISRVSNNGKLWIQTAKK